MSFSYILEYLRIFQHYFNVFTSLYRQKLSELDEITQRLRKKLDVVTNEGFAPPFLCSIHETETFRSEAASRTVSNTKDGNSTKTAAVSSVNEEVCAGISEVAVGYYNFSVNTNDTERSHVKVAEQHYKMPINFSDECENFTSSIVCLLPSNNFAGLSSTITNSLPQSNVTNSQTRFKKGSENGIGTKTSVNHTSSSTDTCYPNDFGSGSKTSSGMFGCEIDEIWNEGVSKTVDMRLQFEHTEDSYTPTDYLMEMCAGHLEVDSVFNPLLFYQLLSSCNEQNISDFGGQHDVECHYQSEGNTNAESSTETVENHSGFGDAPALMNVTRTACLMYSPKEHTHMRNDRLCVNSNSGICDVNRARTEETQDNIK
jgi:hypothetical protein